MDDLTKSQRLVALVAAVLAGRNQRVYEGFSLATAEPVEVFDEATDLNTMNDFFRERADTQQDIRRMSAAELAAGYEDGTVLVGEVYDQIKGAATKVKRVLETQYEFPGGTDLRDFTLAFAADEELRLIFAEFVNAKYNMDLSVQANVTSTKWELRVAVQNYNVKIMEVVAMRKVLARALGVVIGPRARLGFRG